MSVHDLRKNAGTMNAALPLVGETLSISAVVSAALAISAIGLVNGGSEDESHG